MLGFRLWFRVRVRRLGAGMAKVFFDLPLFVILLVGYLLCLVLTMLADEAAPLNPKP